MKNQEIVQFIKTTFSTDEFIPLHEPKFLGSEKEYILACIDSTFVSSVGKYVDLFEKKICEITGSKHAIAVTNGTSALHMALIGAGVNPFDEVIAPSLSFVATANAVKYCHADPIFIDCEKETLGMCPEALETFLKETTTCKDGQTFNKKSGKKISACIATHVLGHPANVVALKKVLEQFDIPFIEDAAAALGSKVNGVHVGNFGQSGIFSFNGNKIVTCGGGGVIVTNNSQIASKLKHITTTAKIPHPWEFDHDQLGYNYRLPNLNAALAVAQLEQLDKYIQSKRELAKVYQSFFESVGMNFFTEKAEMTSNYWLNAIYFDDVNERNVFLDFANKSKVMCRPLWKPLNKLSYYEKCQQTLIPNTEEVVSQIVNIPSSVRI